MGFRGYFWQALGKFWGGCSEALGRFGTMFETFVDGFRGYFGMCLVSFKIIFWQTTINNSKMKKSMCSYRLLLFLFLRSH